MPTSSADDWVVDTITARSVRRAYYKLDGTALFVAEMVSGEYVVRHARRGELCVAQTLDAAKAAYVMLAASHK